jgi:MFS superfamily sulfate permease-like transporter
MSSTAQALPRASGPGASPTYVRDLAASVVVFLVAMPLCMGIAIASGVPPERGLITGIVGGVVVGALAGSPLQVSGPAAGLAVIVFEIVRDVGLATLGPILILAGLIQLAAGALRLGQWFRAISPAVVHGMLAGIGALIVVGQAHVLIDGTPMHSGLANLVAIPGAFFSLSPASLGQAESALAVGLVTIGGMLLWERCRPKALKLVPGALIGVIAGSVLASVLGMGVKRIDVPTSLLASITPPQFADFARLAEPGIALTALAVAFIASAETLLSAAAVDRMHSGPRTRYNKELCAQGVGNTLCGLLGGLPMTGVIVRSSANVQAGAASRLSTMLHGLWILGFVALLPGVLRLVPMAALAGVLVVTGWKLVNLSHVRHLFHRYGVLPALVWAATFAMVVATDLLTGVLVGMALSLLELVPHLRRLRLDIRHNRSEAEGAVEVDLGGVATFAHLPRLSKTLERLPPGSAVTLRHLSFVDHTCAEMIGEWLERRRARGDLIALRHADPDRHCHLAALASVGETR